MSVLCNNILQPTIIDGITYGLDEITNDFNSRPMIYQVEPEWSLDFKLPDINNIVRGEVNRYWLEFDFLEISRYRQLLKALRKPEFTMSFYDRETDTVITGKYSCNPFGKFEDDVQYPNGVATLKGIRKLSFELFATNNDVEMLRIEYLPNGGSGTIEPQTAFFGEVVKLSDGKAYTRIGYDLENWVTDTGAVYNLGEFITATTDLTLRANWRTSATRTLSFDYQGAKLIDKSTQNESDFIVNKEVQYTVPTPTAVGKLPLPTFLIKPDPNVEVYAKVYDFYGWYDFPYDRFANDGIHEKTHYIETTPYTVNGNETIYAHWIPKNYTMKFDSNGGSQVADITTGFMMSIEKPIPTRNGYAFSNWFYDSGFTKPVTQWKMPYSESGSTTVYAKWVSV